MTEIININGGAAVMKFDEWRHHERVPEHTRGTLLRYRDHGLAPGGFITAVLRNDLMGAIDSADMENSRCLVDICRWVYMRLPSAAWGSDEAITDWMRMGGLNGIKAKELADE